MPVKRTAKKKKPTSVWHHDVPPGLMYGTIAVFAFLSGMILLGGVATHADTGATPDVPTTELKELHISLALLAERMDSLEERMDALDGGVPENTILSTDCELLKSALPNPGTMQLVPSSAACFEAQGINLPDAGFMSTAAIYRYTDDEGTTQELNLQIYDMAGNAEAVGFFTTEGAYLPADETLVTREDADVAGLTGSFTYDGTASPDGLYMRGAYWLVADGRFGILAHGTPLSEVDAEKLQELIEAVDLSALQGIE